MQGRIYLIRNALNGKGYVGQTKASIEVRYKKHLENARRGIDFALYRAMRKHGPENFTVVEIATCDPLLLDDLEKHYVKFFGTSSTNGHGYNMTEGGETRRPVGTWNHTEESKRKNSISHKGKKRPPRSPEFIAKQSVAHTGKKTSDETRAKLSEALKGKPRGPMSAEHKAKVSASKKGQGKGKPWSEARRAAQETKGD